MTKIATYFVKDGFVNGDPETPAYPYGDMGDNAKLQADGWYYFKPGADEGCGPYPNENAAIEKARACPLEVSHLIEALMGGKFLPMTEEDREVYGGSSDNAHLWEDESFDSQAPGYGVNVTLQVDASGLSFNVVRVNDNGETEIWLVTAVFDAPVRI